jgi:hypothetical protein
MVWDCLFFLQLDNVNIDCLCFSLLLANKDDLIVVLWLSPHEEESDLVQIDQQRIAAGVDGMRIYDETAASKLFSQGVSVYPSAHSDFLSRSSNLAFDLQARCNVSNSEFVPRLANRMVVVRARKLCTMLTPGQVAASLGFEKTTMIALVMVLTPTLSG